MDQLNQSKHLDSSEEAAKMRETFNIKLQVVELEAETKQNKCRIAELEARIDVTDLTCVGREVLVVIGSFLTPEMLTNLGGTSKEYGWRKTGMEMFLANYVTNQVFETANNTKKKIMCYHYIMACLKSQGSANCICSACY